MNVLILALGEEIGWVLSTGAKTFSGSMDFSIDPVKCVSCFCAWLDLMLEGGHIDRVVYTEMRHGTRTTSIYAQYERILKDWGGRHTIPCSQFSLIDVRKHATGRGNANADLIMARAREKGWSPADDTEAIALWLLDLTEKVDAKQT